MTTTEPDTTEAPPTTPAPLTKGTIVSYTADSPWGERTQTGIVVDVREEDGACAVGWLSGPSGYIDTADLELP
jgi:hypothetical protein